MTTSPFLDVSIAGFGAGGGSAAAISVVSVLRRLCVVALLAALTGCGTMQSLGSRVGLGGPADSASVEARVPMPQAPIPAPAPVVAEPAKPGPAVATAPAPLQKRLAVAPHPAPRTAMQRRPGKYFQDDGPGDIPPELLLGVPEPRPKPEPLADYANQNYRVFGKSYQPAKKREPLRQVGIASWYGRKFHGRKTATGERYDMYQVSAAHPTLPLPSFVRVTNLETNRSIVVRVNDRGPFHPGRIIDLSYAAAAKLGFANQGSTRVAIETILADDVRTPTLAMDTATGTRAAVPAAFR